MKSVLLLLLLLLISSGFGRMLLHRCTVLANSPLERFAYGTALALGIAGFGVFGLGIVGQLSFLPITLWWAVLALAGFVGTLRNFQDLVQWLARSRSSSGFRRREEAEAPPVSAAPDLTYTRLIAPLTLMVLCLTGLFCLLACFSPPTGHEWDVLAYHLADPKVFLLQHRITILPTEHHSNFPFLMEMLYCVGLLYGGPGQFNGYALANMLHLATGALTLVAVLGFCRRVFPGQIGWLAALMLATTPVYLWECCVAYIDVALGLYVTLASFAGIMLIETARRRPRSEAGASDTQTEGATQQRQLREWGVLTGVALGLSLGIKYHALIPFALLPLLLLVRRVPLRSVVLVVAVAALVGSPWYLKSLVLMHNPVYPYLYKLFPASKYWSPDRAAAYASEQVGFGFPHALNQPAETVPNLVQTPWRLTSVPKRFTNGGDYTFLALLGGLYAAGIFPLILLRRLPRPILDLALLFAAQLLAWFFLAQITRYLLSFLPLAAVMAAYGFTAISGLGRPAGQSAAKNLRFFALLATLILTGHVAFLLWALAMLPTSGKAAFDTGMSLTALTLPDVLKNATDMESVEDSKKRHLDIYPAIDWINQNAHKDAGVILYDETRGFYLDRPYLWGNKEHSSYIPYDRMQDGIALTQWLWQHGIRYVLINEKFSPYNTTQAFTIGNEIEYLRDWYMERPAPGQWRFLLADAMRRGLWTPTMSRNGVVVLQISEVRGDVRGGNLP